MHKRRKGRTFRRRKALGNAMHEDFEFPRGKVVKDPLYDKFLEWLRKHNFPKSKLVLAEFPDTGRGMMATSDIETGEVIVSVPKSFLIHNESLNKIYGPHPLSMHQLLALHLCRLKRDPDSWWKPYVDLLPSHFNTMPVKYPKALAVHLPDSLIEEVAQQSKKIKQDYMAALQFLKKRTGQEESLTYEEYEWAWLCVNTRCIHMSTMDSTVKGGNIAMAILLDFLNHSWEAKIESGFNVRTQCFEIRTLTPYKRGQQVFINYGPHDNMAILREYGFALANNNPYNFVLLDTEVWTLFEEMEGKRNALVKRKILEQTGYAGDYSIKHQEISFRLLTALRLLALDGPDVRPGFDQRLLEWQDVVMGETERISADNERRVLLLLKSICHRVSQTAMDKQLALEALAQEPGIHPFALAFVRQIWKETADIIRTTVLEIDERLRQII